MTVEKLRPRAVEKIWGRRDLPAPFGPVPPEAEPVGEIWFDGPPDDDLLVKYLFTSEKLSVQVHPDEQAARRGGLAGGKEEAWWVVAAEEGATIGLGLREPTGTDELRAAALDGSVEQMLDWRPAAAGDSFYSPAGTIHAIGAGLSIVEIQQNSDVTYRLYDYGRDRALHLEQALTVARLEPWAAPSSQFELSPGREILAEGLAFVLEKWTGPITATVSGPAPLWLVPLVLGGTVGLKDFAPGEVLRLEGEEMFSLDEGALALAAYAGGAVREDLIAG